MAKLRTCKICGKQYEYCGHCPSKNLIEPWRNLYCSENCRDSFEVMGQYSVGKISATEAREKLESFGVNPKKVRDVHKATISKIFKDGEVVVVEEPKDIPAVPYEDVPVVEKRAEEPFYRRNKNKKKNNSIVNENLD